MTATLKSAKQTDNKDSQNNPHNYRMGILEHLRELRKRIFYSLIAVTLGSVLTYYLSSEVFAILSAPFSASFGSAPLVGTTPAEAWVLKVKVAIFCSCFLVSPIIFYNLWAFIAPALYPSERRWVIPFVLVSSLLFIGGATFCYYTVLPLALSFFRDEFQSINVAPMINIGEHVSMVIVTMLGCGVVFEMPLITLVLARGGIIGQLDLLRWYRQAIVAIFILSAIITPPDVVSQLLLSVPLLILYAISIGVAYFAGKRAPVDAN
jgi:sec-independent protein translocase protein TatC